MSIIYLLQIQLLLIALTSGEQSSAEWEEMCEQQMSNANLMAAQYNAPATAADEHKLFDGWMSSVFSLFAGDNEAPWFTFKYQVALFIYMEHGWQTHCTGALVSNSFVLTAAHCLNGATMVEVFFGSVYFGNRLTSHEVQHITEENFILHEHFNETNYFNDIALIKLNQKVAKSFRVEPIALACDFMTENFLKRSKLYSTGYSETITSNIKVYKRLKYTPVRLVPTAECQCVYAKGNINATLHMCTVKLNELEAADTCTDHSGAPLIIKYEKEFYLIGITTYNTGECDIALPTIYEKITTHRDWIQANAHLKNDFRC